MTTSATGGYLAPSTTPLDGDALEDVLQSAVAGITGLPGALVRPRWQPTPPSRPDAQTDWAAVGVMRRTPDNFPAVVHDGTGDGTDTVQRHEAIELLASFYGPNGDINAARLRDGLFIEQNRDTLTAAGIALIDVGDIVPAPELANMQWIGRHDIAVNLRLRTDRTYAVLNLLSATPSITR